MFFQSALIAHVAVSGLFLASRILSSPAVEVVDWEVTPNLATMLVSILSCT